MEWILLGLLLVAGYVLGIAGFFSAQSAHRELRRLRTQLEGGAVPDTLRPAVPEPPIWQPAPPAPEPAFEPAPLLVETEPPPPARSGFDIEMLLTQRWGVWAGAAALLLAGVFLVRVVAEAGLLGPGPRCAMAGLLGFALLAAAEWLRRRPAPEGAPWIDLAPSALAAGAVSAWFAAAYGAGPLYELVPSLIGFVLLAAAGVAGLALSVRFGPLVAGVGLAASFGTPLLVQSDNPSMPGLFGYLLFVSAACWAVVRFTGWAWLGWTAGVVGAVYVLVFSATGPLVDVWAPALFVPAAAALSVALLPGAALDHPIGRRLSWAPFLTLGVVGLLLAIVTEAASARAGVLLLGPVAAAVAWRETRLARLPFLAAGLALLVLLTWALPPWQPTGEVLSIEGVVQAVLPGAWAPDAIQPYLLTGAAIALFYLAVGLWQERRSARPLPWAGLAAAMPVLVLAALFLEVGRFQSQAAWAALALVCAAVSVGAAEGARREGGVQRAGGHAAGAVAALALGAAMLLSDQWLTLAVSLLLPPLAWIEARADLPPLRRVAEAVAGVVLVRLVANPLVLDYALGTAPGLNGLLAAYGAPGVSFALTAWMWRDRAGPRLMALLTGGAAALTALLVVLEIHHGAHAGRLGSRDPSFGELAVQVSGLAACAVAFDGLGRRLALPALDWAGRIAGTVALLGGAALILANPALTGAWIGAGAVINPLLAAYAIPALLAALSLGAGTRRTVLSGYALLAVFTWATLEVRQMFHPGRLSIWRGDASDAELWAYSGAWLLLGAALMAAGIWRDRRGLRLAALALVAFTTAKVFLVDMSGLAGLWRVVSFLGLGLSLIGLAAFYRRFGVAAPRGNAPDAA